MKIEIEIDDIVITGTLQAAVKYAVRDWARIVAHSEDYRTVTLIDVADNKRYTLTPESWGPALVQMSSGIARDGTQFDTRHFANLAFNHEDDSETADVLVQLACFREIRYPS